MPEIEMMGFEKEDAKIAGRGMGPPEGHHALRYGIIPPNNG